jgi:hypothetical protein
MQAVQRDLDVNDAPALRSNLEKIVSRVNDTLLLGLRVEAEALESRANGTVPVESGELKASSFTDAQVTAAGNPAATMGYDHEHAGAIHEGFHGGKQKKTPDQFWLQTAANRFASEFHARVGDRIRGAIG